MPFKLIKTYSSIPKVLKTIATTEKITISNSIPLIPRNCVFLYDNLRICFWDFFSCFSCLLIYLLTFIDPLLESLRLSLDSLRAEVMIGICFDSKLHWWFSGKRCSLQYDPPQYLHLNGKKLIFSPQFSQNVMDYTYYVGKKIFLWILTSFSIRYNVVNLSSYIILFKIFYNW